MALPETLVVVPGLNCTGEVFAPVLEGLRRSREVMVADQRQDDAIAGMAERLIEAAPDRFALAGHSMGGYVALEVARRAPGRVTRLGLLSTSARPDPDERKDARRRLIALAEQGRFADVHAALWPALVHPSRRGDRQLEGVVRRMMDETGPEAFIRQERAIMGRADQRSWLPQIEIPTLVLVGSDDAVTPPDLSREMAEMIEWASLVVIPACGHLAPLEEPAATLAAMEAWLASGGP